MSNKPKIGDAKVIVGEVLRADENYRRDLGAFGPDDRRTLIRKYMLEHSISTMRWWYNSRFGDAS